MKTIVVYVRNKNNRPSEYYRFLQYAQDLPSEIIVRSEVPDFIDRRLLSARGHIMRFALMAISYLCVCCAFIKGYIEDRKKTPDYVVVIREIFPRVFPVVFKPLLENSCKRFSLIWDFDDSIFKREIGETEKNIYFKYAKQIVVSTPYLKSLLPRDIHDKVTVLCTTDGDLKKANVSKANIERRRKYQKDVNLLWLATAANMPNLMDIADSLEEAAREVKLRYDKILRLKVVCNVPLERKFNYLQVDNIQWSRSLALEQIMESHVGIMPLMDNKFAKGKAGFKLIQYMAGGLPVIASNVGYNEEVVNNGYGYLVEQKNRQKWIEAICELSGNADKWEEMSICARKQWEEKYSYEGHLDVWKCIFEM